MTAPRLAIEKILCLRVLLVGATTYEREFWASAAMKSAVPVEFLTEEIEDPGAWRSVDICLIDAGVPKNRMEAVVELARSLRPAPLIFMCGMGSAAKPAGTDGVMGRPARAIDARRLFDICIRAKLPSKVLVVDDSATMRCIVKKILFASRFNLKVEESCDGLEAITRGRSGRFDLVFVDYNMPGMNGFATLAEIRKAQPKLTVVMITSALDNGIADRAHAAGAFAFFKKPFFGTDVDTILQRYYGLLA